MKYTHEQIIEACIKIARDAEMTDTIEIVAEMNKAAYQMLSMPSVFEKRIQSEFKSDVELMSERVRGMT